MNRKTSQHQSRREEQLTLTRAGALCKPGIVGFELGPEIFVDSILQSGIPRERPSQPIFSSVRKGHSDCRLNVEIAKAFTAGQCWSEQRVSSTVATNSGRSTETHESGHDI